MNKTELRRLKRGTELKFSPNMIAFWRQEAWSLCSIPGKGIPKEEDSNDYFMRKCVFEGLPYKVYFLDYRRDVGMSRPPLPGAKVKFVVGTLAEEIYVAHDEIERINNVEAG